MTVAAALILAVPDSSPIVEYSGAWMDTPKTDSNWEQYQNQTYHITNQDVGQVTPSQTLDSLLY